LSQYGTREKRLDDDGKSLLGGMAIIMMITDGWIE
jgi:hypothetical protein